jgi:hypothetical protein
MEFRAIGALAVIVLIRTFSVSPWGGDRRLHQDLRPENIMIGRSLHTWTLPA